MNYVLGSQHCRHSGKTHTKTYGPFEENINIQRWEFLTLFIVFVSFFFYLSFSVILTSWWFLVLKKFFKLPQDFVTGDLIQ